MDEMTNEVDVDTLVSQIESGGNQEIPMQAEPQPAPQTPQTASEFEFEARGQKFKVPYNDPRLGKWASQGYDYSQRMQEFKQKLAEVEQREKQFQELDTQYKPYREIDEYARQNPEWWNQVQQAFQQRGQPGLDPNNPLTQELMQTKQQIQELAQFKDSILREKQAVQMQQEDDQLRTEIESIREKYPNLDLNTPDATGETLEYKVLKFASENGIKNFETAFKAFNYERLVEFEKEKAKEDALKELQKNKQAGILGQSTTPTRVLSEPKNIKQMSYDDIHNDILKELGIA